MKPTLVLAAVVLLAGCLAGGDAALAPPEGERTTGAATVRHTSTTLLPLDPTAPPVVARLAKTGFVGTEPTVGVASTGAIFVSAGATSVGRSLDGGRTWEIVGDTVRDAKRTFDPYVHVDSRTDRVFNGHLYVACTWMTWSDDHGETWDLNPLAGCGFPGHDYQKITTGPPARGVATDGYASVVYYVYAAGRDPRAPLDDAGTYVSRSLDGGATFGIPVRTHVASPCGTFGAPIVAGADGVAYSTRPRCDGVDVARTRDSGATWEPAASVDYPEIEVLPYADANVAIDDAGRLLMTYVGGDGVLRYVTSRDEAQTWSTPARLAPPDVLGATLAVNAGGAGGRVAVAYLGTRSDPSTWPSADPSEAPDDVAWHLYLATSEDAFAADPVWTTTRLTPEDDPVQIGCVWLRGGGNPCRNLGDFITMATHEGRPFVTYTDGCDACTSAEGSRARGITVALFDSGSSLLGGPLLPLALAEPAPRAPAADASDARLAPAGQPLAPRPS